MRNDLARGTRLGRPVGWLAALLLVTAIGGFFRASAARAEHIAGATYTGTHSAGGTVQLTVSADGAFVTSFSFTNLPGDSCTFTEGSVTGNIAITNHAFSSQGTLNLTGSFPGIQKATGTMQVSLPPFCTSPTVTWNATTSSPPVADLAVALGDSPDPVLAGDKLSYTATVTNAGSSSAPGVTLTETLPAGVTFVSATASQGSCSQASGVVTCNLGVLASGGSATATVVVTPTQAGQITASATVTSGARDPNTANNSTSQQTTVQAPCIVPNVKGKPLPAAKQAISRSHCKTGKVTRKYSKRVKKGRVISQAPAPRTRLPNLAKVNLVVSRGRKPS